MSDLRVHQQEMKMASENLTIEMEKHRLMADQTRRQLESLIKVAYTVERDGLIRYLIEGKNLSQVASRMRVLLYALRSRSSLTERHRERSIRLVEAEKKIQDSRQKTERVIEELKAQEALLGNFLTKKKGFLKSIAQKQRSFQVAMKEFRQISRDISSLFQGFESKRDEEVSVFPDRGSLPLPVDFGRVVRGFGKSIHKSFQTVTYGRGIEIEAEHNSPVHAILPGVVEFEGWVKGLGNVIILSHGGGFYSLNAHLFKTLRPEGARVSQGEIIGHVGDTGYSERPSLYFELRENGKAIDPLAYFSRDALGKLQ